MPPILTYDKLQPGDLLFVLSPEFSVDQTVESCYSGHVQIFTGETYNPTVHAVSKGNFPATRATRLDDVSYFVIRCNNPAVSAQANALALHWAAFQLPYDLKRQSQITDVEADITEELSTAKALGNKPALKINEGLYENARSAFRRSGVYKMIKYASRRDTAAMLPDDLGGKRGFRCSIFACLVYQIACMGQLTASRNISSQGWASDKYADQQSLEHIAEPQGINRINPLYYYRRRDIIANYRQYVESLQQRVSKNAHPTLDHSHLQPAVAAWDFNQNGDPTTYDFDPIMPRSLQVDATLLTSGSLWYGIAHEQTNFWSVVGVLPKENVPTPTQQEKLAATQDLKTRAATADTLKENVKTDLKVFKI